MIKQIQMIKQENFKAEYFKSLKHTVLQMHENSLAHTLAQIPNMRSKL